MKTFNEYILWITIFCLMINFMVGKLRLLSVVWLYHMQKKGEPNEGISVIICTCNDLMNLKHNIHQVLLQKYPSFEVIVVNDASDDGTKDFLEDLNKQYTYLQVIHIEQKTTSGKKYALREGISAAKYPFVVLTDADCSPASDEWLTQYSTYLNNNHRVVLGYGRLKKQKGFLNTFIRFDSSRIAIQYLSKALWKYPYMGVGRNMGYSKDLVVALDTINKNIASGDDDLFVQAIKNKADFFVMLDKKSFTISESKKTWTEWLNQKGRHTTTAPHYSFFTQLSIMFQWIVSVCFYIGIICILLTGNLQTGFTLFLLNLLCLGLFNGLWLSKLGEKDLILSAPFLDFIYTFVQPVFVIKSWGRKKDQWN